jgi:hypothetical protein
MHRFVLILCLAAGPLYGQQSQYTGADAPLRHVAGGGLTLLGNPPFGVTYMRRFDHLPAGAAIDVAATHVIPQLQLRLEGAAAFAPRGFTALHVRHLTVGALLHPGGRLGGLEVTPGVAPLAIVGVQLWPTRAAPVFVDLSIGAGLGRWGLEGAPGIIPVMRGYLGWGWQ